MKNILILAVVAADIFKENPNLDLYFETSDGEAFYKLQDAKNHAKGLKDTMVKPVERTEPKEAAPAKQKIEEVIAQIEAVTTLEDLEPFKADTRKTVIAAFDKKTAELTNPAE